MPDTLDQTYDRILQSVPSLHQRFVRSALHWLAFSKRPLQLQELEEAAVVNPDDKRFDIESARFFDQGMILELCGSLVTSSTMKYDRAAAQNWLSDKINVEAGMFSPLRPYGSSDEFSVVSLSHFSVKEYLIAPRQNKASVAGYLTSERLANAYLTRSCLFYLQKVQSWRTRAEA